MNLYITMTPLSSRKSVLFAVLTLLIIGFVAYLLVQNRAPISSEIPSGSEQQEPPLGEEQLVEEEWISFTYPRVLSAAEYTLDMDLLRPFETIEVVWSHPGNVQEEAYVLNTFLPESDSARYNISAVLGNLLPGENEYVIYAKSTSDQSREEAQSVSFPLYLDIQSWEEINADDLQFPDLPEATGSEAFEMNATLTRNVSRMRVFSFNPSQKKATFARLRSFEQGAQSLQYNASEKLENLYYGENVYLFEGLDEDGDVVLRKRVSVNSTRLTLGAEVQQLFGTFTQVKGGWYVSSALPWFSLRPVYDEVFYQMNDRSVLVPRPTLQYSVVSDRSTPLCEYLGSQDFEAEGVSYRGYSYEMCQQYRFGVAVYDRFLSLLTYYPLEVVDRLDYQDISERVSSAFVMIETGSMPEVREQQVDLASADENFQQEETEDDQNSDEEEKRYYVFQMLLTEEVPYTDKKIGQIKEEASEERLAQIEEIRQMLTAHGGDRLFSEILFTGPEALDAE